VIDAPALHFDGKLVRVNKHIARALNLHAGIIKSKFFRLVLRFNRADLHARAALDAVVIS